MSPESVMNIGRLAMETTLMVAAPLLLVALIVGLIVSVFQAATQINEATLSFIPKLLSVFITLLLVGPWMLSVLVGYMRGMFSNFSLVLSSFSLLSYSCSNSLHNSKLLFNNGTYRGSSKYACLIILLRPCDDP